MRMVIALLALTGWTGPQAVAAPPPPPEGYQWVLNEKFSDEFNATSLDTNKWLDHCPGWRGRPPAKFVPSGVAVTDGCLELRAGTLPEPDGKFTLAGAAVRSRREEALFGYYEARMKASRISMSSTFWLSGGCHQVGDATVFQEIDITETVGAPHPEPEWSRDWNRFMNSNTHVNVRRDGAKTNYSVGDRAPLNPPVAYAYHNRPGAMKLVAKLRRQGQVSPTLD